MFKLNRAELKKIFLRPAVYVMLFALAIVLVASAFLYGPQSRTDPTTKFGGANQTVAMAFSEFNTSSSLSGKLALDDALLDAKNSIETFAGQDSLLLSIQNNLAEIEDSLTKRYQDKSTFADALFYYAKTQTNENKTKLLEETALLAQKADDLYQTCKTKLNAQTVDFYISTEDLEQIQDYAQRFYLVIPPTEVLSEYDHEALTTFGDNLKLNYAPTSEIALINAIQPIEISEEKSAEIVEKYYTNVAYLEGSDTILTQIYEEIKAYVQENAESSTQDARDGFNVLTTKYVIASQTAINLLNDSFVLEKAGGQTDSQLRAYIGFENFNSYTLTENITLNSYVLDNKLFTTDTLVNLNFNQTSGYTPSAYDFCIFAMQILSVVLTVFAMFFMASSMAGDFQNGAMKMVATRPISRTQIVAGKTMASINFILVFAIFCFVASMAVGYALYGFGTGNVLTVFNATTVITVHPALLMLAYFVSMMLGIIFYIVLANFFAVILRSSIGALFLSLVVYVGGIILTSMFSAATWFMYTPYAYTSLFAFLGGAGSGGFLSFTVPLGLTFFIAVIVYFVMVILIDLISKLIFKTRDIT